MSSSHAATAGLPGWNIADTVLDLKPARCSQHLRLHRTCRKSAAKQGYFVLLVGVDDGGALWLSRKACHHIKRIDPDESGARPDVPHWLPIREVLKDIPAEEYGKAIE